MCLFLLFFVDVIVLLKIDIILNKITEFIAIKILKIQKKGI